MWKLCFVVCEVMLLLWFVVYEVMLCEWVGGEEEFLWVLIFLWLYFKNLFFMGLLEIGIVLLLLMVEVLDFFVIVLSWVICFCLL